MQNEKIVKFMAPDGTPMIQAPENELEKIVSNAVERIATRLFPRKKEYLTRHQVAEMLSITLPTLHAWVNAGKLISHKIGGRTLFDADEVDKALTERKVLRYKHAKR